MDALSTEQVLAMAPDDSSAKAARGLATPAKWPLLGQAPQALWGECQGSGSKPYQVQVDGNGPAFRCSCPSRKFPCKHALALLLQWAQRPEGFTAGEPPPWVAEWLESRRARAEKQAEKEEKKADEGEAEPKPGRRQASPQRWEQMAAGAAELQLWLEDRIRHGLAELTGGGAKPWPALAARMVDAKAPGLALRVRELEAMVGVGGDWPRRLLAAMGRLQLLLTAMERIGELPEDEQADIRAAEGLAPDKEQVAAEGERISDCWLVLGIGYDESGNLWERRVWLQGLAGGRRALLLDFSHGSRNFAPPLVAGGKLDATLAFYPGRASLRALVVEELPASAIQPILPAAAMAEELFRHAEALAANPWRTTLPLLLESAVLAADEQGWWAKTPEHQFPLALDSRQVWRWLALNGDEPGAIFGEWDGHRLRPLSLWGRKSAWSVAP